jgi:plasmid stabilization system protein ParE
MAMAIVILESAEQDLRDFRAYLVKNFSSDIWVDSYAKLKKSMRDLRDFPLAGHMPEEIEKLNLSQYRQVISGLNRIVYEVRQDGIYIHMIVDVRRDMNALLMQRLLRGS